MKIPLTNIDKMQCVTIGTGTTAVVGVGASCVSALRKDSSEGKQNFELYRTDEGYPLPTVVTITKIHSKTTVSVRDIFGKEYEAETEMLEPVLYETLSFEFYAEMQKTAKSVSL